MPDGTPRYNHRDILQRRLQGESWDEIHQDYPDTKLQTIRSSHSQWKKRQREMGKLDVRDGFHTERIRQSMSDEDERNEFNELDTFTKALTGDELSGLRTLDDLALFFDVDPEVWEVVDFKVRGGSHQQHSVKKGFVTLHNYTVTARFAKRLDGQKAELEEVWLDWLSDAQDHSPAYQRVERRKDPADGEPVMAVLAIMDPHIAMLAWGREVGERYDSEIALEDYANAVDALLGTAQVYGGLEEILYIAGNDFLHADTAAPGGKGAATTAGTPQDVDSRMARIFTLGRKALVAGIDQARLVAPVRVAMVPGNHDSQNTYKLGEVMQAWYRHDPEVAITNSPKRDSLPLIMATEAPGDLWVRSEGGLREVLTGHNHRHLAGGYHPTSEASETRAIRTISLSGMTATDSWHFEQGYKHHRAASLRVYYRDGGLAGHHEFTL
jgi:hypothetical protein